MDRLSADVKAEFPQMKGLSDRNLAYMQTFAGAWPEIAQQAAAQLPSEPTKTVQQPVAQLPWGHFTAILQPGRPGPAGLVCRPGRERLRPLIAADRRLRGLVNEPAALELSEAEDKAL
ncbi:MAG: DUF1016 N-terminal domain-containing protein [Acidimicrobiales bacterium]